MTTAVMKSDQLYDWSDNYWSSTFLITATKTKSPFAPASFLGGDSSRLAHRTLQAMREAWLQVRSGSRARSQALPVDQPAGRAASDGVCPPIQSGTGGSVSGELPECSAGARSDLRHQRRAFAPERGVLRNQHGPCVRCQGKRDRRHRRRRDSDGQHAGRFLVGALPRAVLCGGHR
jgi:hypothetical protein